VTGYAVEASEAFARGQIDKRALSLAKRKARRVYDQMPRVLEPKEIMKRQSAYIGWLVAFHPCAPVTSVADMIVNSHVNLAHLDVPEERWPEVNQKIESELWTEFAKLLLDELAETRVDAVDLPSLKDDPLLAVFHHPYLNPYVSRDWVILNIPDGEAKRAGLRTIEEFLRCARKRVLENADLQAVEAAAQHPDRWLRELAVGLLLLLARVHQPARDAILNLLSAKDCKVRFTAISFFQFYRIAYGREFVDTVILLGLGDKSSKLRIMAAEAALQYGTCHLVCLGTGFKWNR